VPTPPVVSHEVVGPEGLALTYAVDDVHRGRHRALDPSDLLGVEAELEHVRWPRAARELCVDSFVAAPREPLDKVGETSPLPVHESGLVDHRRVAANRIGRRSRRNVPTDLPWLADVQDVVPERREVRRLVLVALPADQVSVSIRPEWALDLIASGPRARATSGAGTQRNPFRSEGEYQTPSLPSRIPPLSPDISFTARGLEHLQLALLCRAQDPVGLRDSSPVASWRTSRVLPAASL